MITRNNAPLQYLLSNADCPLTIYPLNVSATITAGTIYPDITIQAPLGPDFQGIAEWTNEAAVDLSTFEPTNRTRVGPRGVLIYDTDLSASEKDRADNYLGVTIVYTLDADGADILDSDNAVIYEDA